MEGKLVSGCSRAKKPRQELETGRVSSELGRGNFRRDNAVRLSAYIMFVFYIVNLLHFTTLHSV